MNILEISFRAMGIDYMAGSIEKIVCNLLLRQSYEITGMKIMGQGGLMPALLQKTSPFSRQTMEPLRATEEAWIKQHYRELQTKYGGEWIIVERESLVAHDVHLVDAVKLAGEKGISIPYLVRIPSVNERSLSIGRGEMMRWYV